MLPIRRTVAVLVLTGAAACATSSGSSAVSGSHDGSPRWTGNFQAPKTASVAVIAAAPRNGGEAYGTIVLTPVPGPTPQTQVDLSVTASGAPGAQVAWAVFTGGCGAATPAIAGQDEFPLIDLSMTGAGTLRAQLPVALDPHLSYHANVYGSSRVTDVSDVMMCAPLSFSSR